MEVNQLHVGTSIQVTAGSLGAAPGLPNLAHQSATQASTVPGTIWADGGLHIGSPIFVPGETLVGFARAPVLTNPKASANLSIFKVTSRGFTPTPIDVVVGDPSGPVGVAVNGTQVNMLIATSMNIVCPATNHVGTFKVVGLESVIGAKIAKAVKTAIGKESKIGAFVSSGAKAQNGVLKNNGIVANPVSKTPVVVGTATGNKPASAFDIPHWKKKNTRVRHLCAEGPEAGIYIRGKLEGSNVIELPEYWQGLVDYDTITVSLTPFGKPDKSLYVKNITEDKVIVSSDHLTQVKCFYEVWVARWIDPRDHDKILHVTYEGETPADYPGDPKDFLVGGWDYDRRKQEW
jgi:hypothetical protein